jgi:hypothetical protein
VLDVDRDAACDQLKKWIDRSGDGPGNQRRGHRRRDQGTIDQDGYDKCLDHEQTTIMSRMD